MEHDRYINGEDTPIPTGIPDLTDWTFAEVMTSRDPELLTAVERIAAEAAQPGDGGGGC